MDTSSLRSIPEIAKINFQHWLVSLGQSKRDWGLGIEKLFASSQYRAIGKKLKILYFWAFETFRMLFLFPLQCTNQVVRATSW